MLGLAEQVGRDHFHVRRVVGNHEDLRRPGEQVDADASVKLPLGFGHVRVARSAQHVDRTDGPGAQCHGRDCLHATKDVDLVRAPENHRRNGFRVRFALVGRGAGDHAAHARGARSHDAHVRRGDHRIAAAGHIAADAVDRNGLVAEFHTGKGFDFDVPDRSALVLREIAYLLLRKADVVERAR